jgi:hypothetical protein
VVALHLGAERDACFPELERRPHGPQSVVLVERAKSEDPNHTVADEPLDRSAVALEHVGADGRAAVDHRVQGLRIELLGEP